MDWNGVTICNLAWLERTLFQQVNPFLGFFRSRFKCKDSSVQEQSETTHYLCTASLGFEHCWKYSAYACEFNVRLKTCQAWLDPPYWLFLSQFWLLAVKNILLSDTQNLVLASEIHKNVLPKSPFWLGKIMCRCLFSLPSGKHTKNLWKITICHGKNPLFLWPF